MASVTSLGSTLDKTYQMEIAAANFRTNGHILTSALHANFDDTVQTNRDAMKRKLTARVSPMTRPPEGALDPKFYPQFSDLQSSHRADSCKTTDLDVGSTTTSVSRSKQRLAEKRKSVATNVIIPSKAVKSESILTTQDEPVSKRPRTILPRIKKEGKEKYFKSLYCVSMSTILNRELITLLFPKNIFILLFSSVSKAKARVF